MRLGEVFRYEFAHRLRSLSTWLYGGFLFLLSFYLMHVAVSGTNPVHVNAPQGLAEKMALFCGLFGILVTAGLFSDAALRDCAAGMDALLFTTRLRPAEYLGGRFLAALAINSILIFAIPLALFIPTQPPAPLQPVLSSPSPNLVWVGAILFRTRPFARHAIPVYLGAIAIFIGY